MSHFSPFSLQKITRTALFVLAGGVVVSAAILSVIGASSLTTPSSLTNLDKKVVTQPLQFSLGAENRLPDLSFYSVGGDLSLSAPKVRLGVGTKLFLHLKNGGVKEIVLPCRIYLESSGEGQFSFSEIETPFWIDLREEAGRVGLNVWIQMPEREAILSETLAILPKETPVETHFAEGSPFFSLGMAKWLGHDLFEERYGEKRAIHHWEIGNDVLKIKEGDWIGFQEGHWKQVEPAEGVPIVHVEKVQGNQLFWEGWNGDVHVRGVSNLVPAAPFKAKGEELFTSLRARSEKQISCMLEKQSLILRVGDWVCKTGDKWRLLRKKEDREAFVRGEISGDLFVFDKIEKGQKVMGTLFHPSRLQAALIELPAVKGKEDGTHRKRRPK